MKRYGIHVILIQLLFVNSDQNLVKRHVLQNNVIESSLRFIMEPLDVPCTIPVCEGPLSNVYCHGDILSSAWQFGLQKTCPGDRMKYSSHIVLQNFNNISFPLKFEEFEKFCEENFDETNYLKEAKLDDWIPNPSFLAQIKNEERRKLANKLHEEWKVLAREFNEDVFQNPHLYPIWPVKNTFVVPGGRFDVYFYWDTYWILRGLLVSNMTKTAEGIINNFADLVATHGFIPNSGNIQLSKRTQPPLFCHMVRDYTKITGEYNKNWLERMSAEILFWEKNRTISVENKIMFVYKTSTNCPRPESFMGDYRVGINQTNPQKVWASISAACESGWDFSSRWMNQTTKTLSSLHADRIVPVDLNVFMANNYRILADYYDHFKLFDKSAVYRQKLERLTNAIHSIHWDEKNGAWFDYDLDLKQKNINFYPSNVFPLLIKGFEKFASRVAEYIKSTGALDYNGGVPTTLPVSSHEQWDFPNVWAPTQHLLIQSFLATNDSFLLEEAERQSSKFINAVRTGLFNPPPGRPGAIFEKYDARSKSGTPGGGGEYLVQEGFGWTNGAVLDLIWAYRASEEPKKEEKSIFSSYLQEIVIVSAWLLSSLLLVCFLLQVCSWRKMNRNAPEQESEGLLENEDDGEDV